jgi:prepilin-type N-terminal cleavage/methylation domain-containing protein
MAKERGFSLVEVIVGLFILTIVITTTIVMFTDRQRRLRQANETILVYQALSNESEIWRRIDFKRLDQQQLAFQSDTSILQSLTPFNTAVKIDTPRPDIKNVTFTVKWNSGQRQAHLSILRADTGGSSLW